MCMIVVKHPTVSSRPYSKMLPHSPSDCLLSPLLMGTRGLLGSDMARGCPPDFCIWSNCEWASLALAALGTVGGMVCALFA